MSVYLDIYISTSPIRISAHHSVLQALQTMVSSPYSSQKIRQRENSKSPLPMGKRFIIEEEEEDMRYNNEKKVNRRGISKRFVFVGIASAVFMMSILFMYLKESSDEMNDLLEHRGSSNTVKKSGGHLRFDKNSKRLKLKQNSIDQCSVFYAESSVPNGGMGIYTTIPRQAGDQLLVSDGPSIPVIDADHSNKSKKAWIQLFNTYWWGNGQR